MAQGAFAAAALKSGLNLKIDSAGTAPYHIGDGPDPRAVAVARRHGVDISALKGRQLDESDFANFTHIFALDTANMAGIDARAPRKHGAQLSLLMDVLEDGQGASISDPYYGDESDFEACWAQIVIAVEELAKQLETNRKNHQV